MNFSRQNNASNWVFGFLLSGITASCATAQSARAAQGTPSSATSASVSHPNDSTASSTTAATPRRLTRGLVAETVSAGLGSFLSRVDVTPVLNGSRFLGFRLEAAEDLATWNASGADIRVGDVIQRINGQTVERPEQALSAFQTLLIAPGIEIHGLRSGAPFRTFVAVSE